MCLAFEGGEDGSLYVIVLREGSDLQWEKDNAI